MKDKGIKLTRWILVNGFCGSCGIFAVLYGIEWCENVITFTAGLMYFTLIPIVFSQDIQEKLKKEGSAVPVWIDGVYDVVFMFLFASAGWYWTAGAFALSLSVIQHVYKKDNASKKDS
jgi:hypothetical protein